jgi:hypothetical protein
MTGWRKSANPQPLCGCADNRPPGWAKTGSYHGEILDVPLIFVKVMERGDEENRHRYFAAPGFG